MPTPPKNDKPSKADKPSEHTEDATTRIEHLLARITELSDDELTELRDLVLQSFDAQKAPPADKVVGENEMAQLEALAAAAIAVKAEQERRDDLGTRAHSAMTALAALVPAGRGPQLHTMTRASAITASGAELRSGDDLVVELTRAWSDGRAPNTHDGRVRVASISADRPATRQLGDDAAAVTAALASAARTRAEQALTAAGGLGAPEDADYALPGFAVPDRPVKGALPSFTATRGGIRFTRPPLISDVDGAIGVWTVEDDIAAATDSTIRKPTYRIGVGPEIVVNVEAITNSLIFGNMLARAYPEFVSAATDVALAAHARVAEQRLLTSIGALSTHVTGLTHDRDGMAKLGATRMLLPTLELAAHNMRDRLRTGDGAVFQCVLPWWVRGLLRSDLALQEPGDGTLGVSNADVDSYLAERGISPTYALDGEAGQEFDQQVMGELNDWPGSAVVYMYPVGAWQFIDGGTLDLGIVRDSTLNAANDFALFTETFEAAVFRGGLSLRIEQPLSPTGIARAAA